MIATFAKNLNPAAKTISIGIIIVLIGIIGVLLYRNIDKIVIAKNDTSLKTSSSSDPILNLQAYVNGRDNLEAIIAEKLKENPQTAISYQAATATPYTIKNIRLSYDTSSAALRAYGLQIAKAMAPYNTDQENEVAITLDTLETKDPSGVQKLLSIVDTNKQVIATLLKMQVPNIAAQIHLDLINAMNRNTAYIQDMTGILDNPATALTSADSLRVGKLAFYKAVDKINKFFQDNNIIFSDQEGSKIYMSM